MSFDWHVWAAARVLRRGGVLVHPTDTVLGLAASVFRPDAIDRVSLIKSRPPGQTFIVIAADIGQIQALVELDTPFYDEIVTGWPGPNTWRLRATPLAPSWLSDEDGCIAVRIPGLSQARALCSMAGPLISTSANRRGRPTHRSLIGARKDFGTLVDGYLSGPAQPGKSPSRLRDGLSGEVIRG